MGDKKPAHPPQLSEFKAETYVHSRSPATSKQAGEQKKSLSTGDHNYSLTMPVAVSKSKTRPTAKKSETTSKSTTQPKQTLRFMDNKSVLPKPPPGGPQPARAKPIQSSSILSGEKKMNDGKASKRYPAPVLVPVNRKRPAVPFFDPCPPVEEDALPPSMNPAGVYAPLYRDKRKREMDSTTIVPLPPRVIGGLRDQIKKVRRCNCRNSQCLKLYCECFTSGILCTGQCSCTGCCNDGAAEHAKTRTQAILGALVRDPGAFRPTSQQVAFCTGKGRSFNKHTKPCTCRKSRCLKAYCECFQKGDYCQLGHCGCEACQNYPGNKERDALIAKSSKQEDSKTKSQLSKSTSTNKSAATTKGTAAAKISASAKSPTGDDLAMATAAHLAQLPPSAYTVPMKIGETPVSGLSFSRASAPSRAAGSKSRSSLPQPSKLRPNQNAAKLPTQGQGTPTSPPNLPNRKRIILEETDLEKMWRAETANVSRFFGTMRSEFERRQNHDGAQTLHDEELDEGALACLKTVEEDMKGVKMVVEAAEFQIRSRLHGRRKGGGASKTKEENGHDEVDSWLRCEEELPVWQPNELAHEELKELTILAAQDAALLRETARLIRKKARELCERRSY